MLSFPINIPDNTAIPPWARLTITDSGDPGFSYGLSYALAKDRVRLNNVQTTPGPTPSPSSGPTATSCPTCTDAVAVGAGAGAGGLVLGALLAAIVSVLCLRHGHTGQRLGMPKSSRYEMGHPGWTTIPQHSDGTQSSSLLMPWLRNNPGIQVEPFEPPVSPSREHSSAPRSPSFAGGSFSGGHSQRNTTLGSNHVSEHEVHKSAIPPHLAPNQPSRPTTSTSNTNILVSLDVPPPTNEFEVEELPPAYQRRPRRKT